MTTKNSIARQWAFAAMALLMGTLLWNCNRKAFPEKLVPARDAFDQSVLSFWEAENMFNPKPGQAMVFRTPQQEKVMFGKIQNGIDLSGQVTDEFLDYIHPELKKMYREVLIPGKKMYLEGALSGDRVTQVQGSKLVLQWTEFLDAHQKEISQRMYPDQKPPSSDPGSTGNPHTKD